MLLLNGHLLPTAPLALPNRGFTFGDGFFETLILVGGRLRFGAQHFARMQAAAAALYLELPEALASAEQLEQEMTRLATANELPAARIRLQIWRAGGGLYTPETSSVEWLATAVPYVPNVAPIARAAFAQDTYAIYSPLSFCKGPQAWIYVRAARERQQRGFDELLLLSGAGHVAETVSAAIFWIQNAQLFTPALSAGCVAGVRRAHLLQVARQQGIECHETLAFPNELHQAEAVFSANVAGIRWIKQLSTVCWETEHPLLSQLRHWEAQP
ncbi:aminotransferase class IV [Hymenobacter lutimineralis]|uniref:branched-chain-amino-acid transaminase n=1 Tax=Hymenobacter lutimineralis TaxID=2606448 RepID=A0A5D6UZ72_9BACT|nr:aminotransferase class IV [Hymenobacter lutimineralis]TYZ08420.1 aminotransferase class IV [Hymenobacter lutimineralis]